VWCDLMSLCRTSWLQELLEEEAVHLMVDRKWSMRTGSGSRGQEWGMRTGSGS
jgi:hypothetical protein